MHVVAVGEDACALEVDPEAAEDADMCRCTDRRVGDLAGDPLDRTSTRLRLKTGTLRCSTQTTEPSVRNQPR